MYSTLGRLGIAVASGSIVFLMTTLFSERNVWIRSGGGLVVALLAFGIAAWAGRRHDANDTSSGISVGNDIDSQGSTLIESVSTTGQHVKTNIGNRIKSGKDVTIKDIKVNDGGPE